MLHHVKHSEIVLPTASRAHRSAVHLPAASTPVLVLQRTSAEAEDVGLWVTGQFTDKPSRGLVNSRTRLINVVFLEYAADECTTASLLRAASSFRT